MIRAAPKWSRTETPAWHSIGAHAFLAPAWHDGKTSTPQGIPNALGIGYS
jgi:hypothetical protein